MNAIHYFHASFSSYASFWKESFAPGLALTNQHTYLSFLHFTICLAAKEQGQEFRTVAHIAPMALALQAFQELGNGGILPGALEHACADCHHPYCGELDIC
jgi:hypothetical protein